MAAIKFFPNSKSYFESLLQQIDSAEQFIVMEYYIFDYHSRLGSQVLQALERAAHRGVSIELRLDGVGSRQWIQDENSPLQNISSAQLSIFNPVPWPVSRIQKKKPTKPRQWLHYWSHLNRRNHKKLCVIDQKIAFVGSMNIHDEALDWVEMGVMSDGSTVKKLLSTFQQTSDRSELFYCGKNFQSFSTKSFLQTEETDLEILVQNNRKQRSVFRKIHKIKFRQAKNRIILVTPYFIPSLWLMKSLLQAQKRGVEVLMLLPEKLDHKFMKWIMDKYIYSLIEAGVKVFRYDEMVHAKVVVVDEWLHLGSCNLNQRSMHLDLELNLVIDSKEIKNRAVQKVESLIEKSKAVTLESLNQRPIYEKVIGTVLLIFRSFL